MPPIPSIPLTDLPPPYIAEPLPVYTRTEPPLPYASLALSPSIYENPYDLEANRSPQVPQPPISRTHISGITHLVPWCTHTLPEAASPIPARKSRKVRGWLDDWIVIIIVLIVLSLVVSSVISKELNAKKSKVDPTPTPMPRTVSLERGAHG
jgi:hypothetical protein